MHVRIHVRQKVIRAIVDTIADALRRYGNPTFYRAARKRYLSLNVALQRPLPKERRKKGKKVLAHTQKVADV